MIDDAGRATTVRPDTGAGTTDAPEGDGAGTTEARGAGAPASEGSPTAAPPVPFAHASEAEMARILDFYAVRWEYEPHTFPLLWNLDGDVTESFSPDFWLPDLDLYLEMTTLKQRLVRKKNRKLRRLRELYPSVRIKLFYARDFRALMLKYGKLALVEAISGTAGHVVPLRPASVAEPAIEPPSLDAPSGSPAPEAEATPEAATPARVAPRSSPSRRGAGRRARRRSSAAAPEAPVEIVEGGR